MWTKAIDRSAEVAVRALDNVPLLHVRSESIVDHGETSVEETTAEVAKIFIPCIIASACA